MPNALQTETPLGALLPPKVKALLKINGITTVEGVHKAYPFELIKLRGMGMLSFRRIETTFFPGKSFMPVQAYAPLQIIKGTPLRGVLPTQIVGALACRGILNMEHLRAVKRQDLLRIEGIGGAMLQEIERVLYLSGAGVEHPV